MDKAIFTLSLDCEGLWGVADNDAVIDSGCINQASLTQAYSFIRETLDKHQLKATAAFVTCFAVDPEVVMAQRSLLGELQKVNPRWFRRISKTLDLGVLDGWSGAPFFKSLQRDRHEMAWHGTTHQSLADSATEEAIALEMELTQHLWGALDQEPRSVVFPRNVVGQLERLRGLGLLAYRAAPSRSGGRLGRLLSLASEFNVFDRGVSDRPFHSSGWDVLPAGHFLNWPAGLRRLVPPRATLMRWRSLLEAAVETRGYVHMWFHPHNLITAPAMAYLFDGVLGMVAERVKAGEMLCLPMGQITEVGSQGVQR